MCHTAVDVYITPVVPAQRQLRFRSGRVHRNVAAKRGCRVTPGAEATAFRTACQAGSDALHGGRTIARRFVRLQAGTRETRRESDRQGESPQGTADAVACGKFRQGGESGLWISDLYPEVREHADKLCLIHSMQTDIPAHPPAFIQMHTGISTSPRPSMGAWVLYGLGPENANLPGFVTICAPSNNGGSTNFGSAFLPASYQGTKIGTNRQPISRAQIANLKEDHGKHAGATDKPIAGLLTDLAARGLLKDTLVLWGGEFGRTPYGQGGDGRDHNHTGYTTWMAGGGVKGGFQYGATDDFGYEAIADKVHIHDWHATILHLLGLDHERLTFRHAGRDMRLTDVKGRVHEGILS